MSVTESTVVSETVDGTPAKSLREDEIRPQVAAPAAFNSRGFTTLFLTLAFGVLLFSGVVMYLTPRGRLANWSEWQMLGLAKEEWASLHANISILFVVVALLHLVLNWSIFLSYLRRRAIPELAMRKELVGAAVVSAIFVAGPILDYPPFRSIMILSHRIKDYWELTDVSSVGWQVTETRSPPTNGTDEAVNMAGKKVDRGGPARAVHQGGPSGEGFGLGHGMGWGRQMGGGWGLGPGGGSGRAIEEESPSSAAATAQEGN